MIHLYLTQRTAVPGGAGAAGGRQAAAGTVAACVADYMAACGRPLPGAPAVSLCHRDDGMPYLAYAGGAAQRDASLPPLPCISVSHSGPWWACLLSALPCGLDIQVTRPFSSQAHMLKLARRFFEAADADWVSAQVAQGSGLIAFYRVWTRREALAKCTGTGLFGAPLPPVIGVDGPCPMRITMEGRAIYLRDIEAGPKGLACSIACEEDGHEIHIVTG